MGKISKKVCVVKKIAFFFILALSISLDARLYFLHIPKTAGTTLRLLLELQVSANEIYPYRNYTHARGPIEKNLISGHFPYWFCKKFDPDFDKAFKVTILRDPVERYLSYLRAKKRGNSLFADLESVIERRSLSKNKISAGLIDNALCRYLSADPCLEGEALLESAKQTLEEFDCVLFFDQVEQDVVDLFKRLGIELDKEEIPQINVTTKEPVREELLEEIKKLNELDLQLYQYAKNQIKRKENKFQLRTKSFDNILHKTCSIDYSFDFPLNGKGWSYRETFGGDDAKHSTYRWVMNRPANIYFSLEEGIDYNLYFTSQSLTNEILPRVQVNGKEIELLKLDDRLFATYYGKIPKEYIREDPTELLFYSLKSFPYADIYPNYPNRNYPPLSFAINSIKIN
jgi:hypothetical protein